MNKSPETNNSLSEGRDTGIRMCDHGYKMKKIGNKADL